MLSGVSSEGAPGWLSWTSVRLLMSAQVMISQFVGLSPASGCALTAWDSLSLPLSLPLPLPPQKKINKINLKKKIQRRKETVRRGTGERRFALS